MKANPQSIEALFNSQMRYVIPMFQRLYVWQETPQWTTLWEDVVEKADAQLVGKKSNAHYLGALIIEGVRPSSPREVKRFLVIDGQQRLTTLQLLLCAYRDLARMNAWKTLDRATSRYLENADADVMEHPDEEVFKLWPTTLNRDIFRKLISAGASSAVEQQFPLVRLPRKRSFEPRSNLVEAYLYFSRTIASWISKAAERTKKTEEECAFALLQALQQDFCVVEIALSEGDDSQEIFYSLNSQGRPLSQSDLLRSLIFMRAEKDKIDRDALFSDYWNKFETSFWSTEEKRGGRTYSRLDLGLRFFLMAKTGALVDARRVNEEYKTWITAPPPRYTSVREELADFTRYTDVYQRYQSTIASSLPSTDLRRILIDFDVSTALPLVLYLELDAGLDDEQRKECLGILESFIARRAFTREETKEYNRFFVDIIGTLKEVKGEAVKPAFIKKLLSGKGTTRVWPTDEGILDKAISGSSYTTIPTTALRLMLERLEVAQRTKKSEAADLPPGLQIEHIMPEQWSTHWALNGKTIPLDVMNYPHLAKDDLAEHTEAIRTRNIRVQTLGNLTLLNMYLNPAASNGSFTTKIVEYEHSVLRLNRYFQGRTIWDEEAITERSKQLGELLCTIWPRPHNPTENE